MSYGYTSRQDPAPRVVPARGPEVAQPPNRIKAAPSDREKILPGKITSESLGDLANITQTIVTPESVTTPEVLAARVSSLEGQFESLSALSANMGEVTAGIVRDEDNRFRIDLDNAVLVVRDEQGSPGLARVVLGRLDTGPEDYGIAVYNSVGLLILGANGLGTNVVGTDQVQNQAIGNAQIADLAVNNAKIANLAVGTAKIADLAVATGKIANLAVNNAKIANVQVDKLLAGALAVDQFIRSTNYSAGSAGWNIHANGDAEFNNVTIRGTLDGVSGTFAGDLQAAGGTFSGGIRTSNLTIAASDATEPFDNITAQVVPQGVQAVALHLKQNERVFLSLAARALSGTVGDGRGEVVGGEDGPLHIRTLNAEHLVLDPGGLVEFLGPTNGSGSLGSAVDGLAVRVNGTNYYVPLHPF
jgi:hypothetical protein